MSKGTMDKTALEILRLLQNGRRSFKEIGREVGLSEATVRSRVGRMIESGLIEIKALVSTRDLGPGYHTAYVGVRLKSPAMKKTAEAMGRLPGVISVAMVTGRYDLILTVMLTPEFEFIDFFNVMLERYSESISSNETFLVYENVSLKTPYPF